jgi:hypothetical protein
VVITLVTDEVTNASTAIPHTSHKPCHIRPTQPKIFLRPDGLPAIIDMMEKKLSATPSRHRRGKPGSYFRSKMVSKIVAAATTKTSQA